VSSDGSCSAVGCAFNVLYRAAPREANRIVVRSDPDGGLVLTDSAAPIQNNAQICALRGPHTIACGGGVESVSLTVHGGDLGDVIDARGFRGYADLIGGRGDDKLYVAGSLGQLTGGGGHNLLVGNSSTTVSYERSSGPVTVDLARGFGIAPGERDRIVGVGSVTGGTGLNRLVGSRFGGQIIGGPGRNYLVARGPHAVINLPNAHQPSTVRCASVYSRGRSTYVGLLRAGDLALGPCRVASPEVQMLPLRSLDSPVLELRSEPARQIVRVTLLALPSNASVGSAPGPVSRSTVYCHLSAVGKRLLRRSGRLRVRIKAEFRKPPSIQSFTTVLRIDHPNPR
jgi:Ca2+-binding RTX toxin-like protein